MTKTEFLEALLDELEELETLDEAKELIGEKLEEEYMLASQDTLLDDEDFDDNY